MSSPLDGQNVCVCVCVVSSLSRYKARYNTVLDTQTTDSAIHYMVHWLARLDCASMGQFYLLKSALPSVFDGNEYISLEPIYNGLSDPVTEEGYKLTLLLCCGGSMSMGMHEFNTWWPCICLLTPSVRSDSKCTFTLSCGGNMPMNMHEFCL